MKRQNASNVYSWILICAVFSISFQTAKAKPISCGSSTNDSLADSDKSLDCQSTPADCPSVFPELIINLLSIAMSNMENFRASELPPFLVTRIPGTPGNTQVREYIKATFESLTWQVEEDPSIQNTPYGPFPFINVIVTLNPAAPRRLVMACHYDSIIFPLGFIGATDAAVPCAILVDIARRLTPILRFIGSDTTLQMIFFDGEEAFVSFTDTDSLYGSRNLATVWQNTVDPLDPTKNRLENIIALIVLDIAGHAETQFQRFFPETDLLFTSLIQFEECLLQRGYLTRSASDARLFSDSVRPVPIDDDHKPFQERGVSVMHLIGYPFPSFWHTLNDNAANLDNNVIDDLSRILRIFVTNAAVVAALQPVG